MTGRRCGTCKHYEHAPIWRKGWCRNPLLYSPQQSHLIGEEDLDCERGMGNYWEPADASTRLPQIPLHPVWTAEVTEREQSASDRRLTTTSGQLRYSVSGASGYSGDPLDDEDVPRDRRAPDPRGSERHLDYYSDEHYWTDYVRVGLPIFGVLLILLVFLMWILPWLTDGDDDGGEVAGDGTATTTLPIIGAGSPTTTVQVGGTGTAQIVQTASPTPTVPAGAQPTPTGAVAPGGGEIFEGATVQVANTGGTGVNMRASASVEGEVVAVIVDGTEFVTTGPAEEADGFFWWPVEGEAGSGYIVEDYLVLVE